MEIDSQRERRAARFVLAGKLSDLSEVDDMLEHVGIMARDLSLELFREKDEVVTVLPPNHERFLHA